VVRALERDSALETRQPWPEELQEPVLARPLRLLPPSGPAMEPHARRRDLAPEGKQRWPLQPRRALAQALHGEQRGRIRPLAQASTPR